MRMLRVVFAELPDPRDVNAQHDLTELLVVALDGKSLRRGYEAGRTYLPPLLVSAWGTRTRMVLAQRAAPEGSQGSRMSLASHDLEHAAVLPGGPPAPAAQAGPAAAVLGD